MPWCFRFLEMKKVYIKLNVITNKIDELNENMNKFQIKKNNNHHHLSKE